MARKRLPKKRNKTSYSIAISLILHLGIFLFLVFSKESQPIIEAKKDKQPIEISFIEAPQVKKDSLQVVEQNEKALNDETPTNAKFLSKNNQRVVKQQVAKNSGQFQNTTGKPKQSEIAKKKARKNKLKNKLPTLADLKPKFKLDFNEDTIKEEHKNLPTTKTSQSNDYLKDINPGLQTLLSTKEFVYYTYYSRIRTRLSQHWNKKLEEKVNKIFNEGRTIASSTKDRVTELIIILNKQGILQKVQIQGRSGVHDLDDAAVEAFKEAAPFPNPPKGMVEEDGTVQIHWSLVLEA